MRSCFMSNVLLKESNFISAVIYINNEAREVNEFVNTIYRILNENFCLFEIICVLDGKFAYAIKIQDVKRENISVIHMGIKQGVEASMNAGMNLAIGDYVVEFDSTYKDYNDDLFMKVYKRALDGYDVVGARVPKSYSNIESRVFYKVFNAFSFLDDEIGTERFRIISRRAINRAESYSKTIPYRKVIYLASGLKVTSVEYEPVTTVKGNRPKDSFRKETAMDTLLIFTNIAYKMAMLMSVTMSVLMLAFLVYTCFIYFGSYVPVEGWSPIMGILTIGFCGLFLLSAFLIKYLQLLLKINFKNDQYFVETIEKLK